MHELKTWDDVVRAARQSPVLSRVVELARPDRLTREEALIQGVLALQQMLDEATEREVRRAMLEPPRTIELSVDGKTLFLNPKPRP